MNIERNMNKKKITAVIAMAFAITACAAYAPTLYDGESVIGAVTVSAEEEAQQPENLPEPNMNAEEGSGIAARTLYDDNDFTFDDVTGTLTIKSNCIGTSIWKNVDISARDIKSVIIENGVTEIEADSFKNCTNLVSVTIPETVTSIGGYAFYKNTSLMSVVVTLSGMAIALRLMQCINAQSPID